MSQEQACDITSVMPFLETCGSSQCHPHLKSGVFFNSRLGEDRT